MKNYKPNHKRNRFKSSGHRNFRKNGNGHKSVDDFSNNSNFRRKNPGRNNIHASKLIEKYKDLAREALSNGDKILSENYFQHADHFTRILNEKEIQKKISFSEKNSVDIKNTLENDQKKIKESSDKDTETNSSEDVQSEVN